MAKKKPADDHNQNESDRKRNEDYERRMARGAREEGEAPIELHTRKPQPGVFGIDDSQFNPTRRAVICDALTSKLKWPCCIWGEVGRGKTYLAAAIYMQWIGTAVWMTYTEFCRHAWKVTTDGELNLSDGDGRPLELSIETWWDHVANAGVFVLDDVGVGEYRESRNEAVKELLDRRDGKPLILTSNLAPENMDRRSLYALFDDRVMSRIRKGRRIELTGPDLRGVGQESAA